VTSVVPKREEKGNPRESIEIPDSPLQPLPHSGDLSKANKRAIKNLQKPPLFTQAQVYSSQYFFNDFARKRSTIPDPQIQPQPSKGLIDRLEMTSKPPRLRRRATPDDAQQSPAGAKIGPLPVSALAGLIAGAFALFVIGTWLTVILIRRKRRRDRSTGAIRGRQKGMVPDEEADQKHKSTDNTDLAERRSMNHNIKSTTPYLSSEQVADEFKYDPCVYLFIIQSTCISLLTIYTGIRH